MYRYIKNVPVFAQATHRDKAIATLNKYSDTLAGHVAKCVAYKDSLNCLHHWLCEEIADWISIAAAVKLKGGKLKARVYEDTLFGFLGDEKSDAFRNLKELQVSTKHGNSKYPYFDITDDMINNMYNFSKQLSKQVSIMLEHNKGKELNDKELQDMLMRIYNSTVK